MSDLPANPTPTDLEAASWYMRLSEKSVTTDEVHEFYAWRRNAANAKAYAEVEATWEVNKRLALDPDIQTATAEALRRRLAVPRLRHLGVLGARPFAIGATLAAALVIAAETTWMLMQSPSYETRLGEQRLIELKDGSRVRLNTNSRVIVRFKRDERRVVLARGEAFFEAAHDAARPFIVEADDARVRAIGTKFDVRRDGAVVRVSLVEGNVRVAQANRPGAKVLQPDQELTITNEGVTNPQFANAAETSSWTSGRLIFHALALEDAIKEVNRYGIQKIELDGPAALERTPVSGIFNVGDTASFLSAVAEEFNLKAVVDDRGVTRLTPRA